jgi:hypothetical protein
LQPNLAGIPTSPLKQLKVVKVGCGENPWGGKKGLFYLFRDPSQPISLNDPIKVSVFLNKKQTSPNALIF